MLLCEIILNKKTPLFSGVNFFRFRLLLERTVGLGLDFNGSLIGIVLGYFRIWILLVFLLDLDLILQRYTALLPCPNISKRYLFF